MRRRRPEANPTPDDVTCPVARPRITSRWVCDNACGFRGTLDEVADHERHHCPNRVRPLVNKDEWCCAALDLSINRLRSLRPLTDREGPPTGLTLPMSGGIIALVSYRREPLLFLRVLP